MILVMTKTNIIILFDLFGGFVVVVLCVKSAFVVVVVADVIHVLVVNFCLTTSQFVYS